MTRCSRFCSTFLMVLGVVAAGAAAPPALEWKRDVGFSRVITAGHLGRTHRLTVLAATDDGSLFALSPGNGATLWKFSAGDQQMGCPAIGDVDVDGANEVVVGSSDTNLYVLNGDDGRVKWRFHTGGIITSAPVVARLSRNHKLPEVVVATGLGTVHCLRGDGRQAQWERKLPRPILASPAVADVNGDRQLDVLVMTDQGQVEVLEGYSGTELASHAVEGGRTSGPIALDLNRDGRSEFVLGGTHLEAFGHNRQRFGLFWRYEGGGEFAGSAAAGDLDGDGTLELVALSRDGVVHCLNAVTGKAKWTLRVANTTSACTGSPILVDLTGTRKAAVVVCTPDGYLTAIDDQGKQLWKESLGGYADVSPAVLSADGGKSLTLLASEAATRTVRALRVQGGGLILWGKLGSDAGNTGAVANAVAFGNVLRGVDAK